MTAPFVQLPALPWERFTRDFDGELEVWHYRYIRQGAYADSRATVLAVAQGSYMDSLVLKRLREFVHELKVAGPVGKLP